MTEGEPAAAATLVHSVTGAPPCYTRPAMPIIYVAGAEPGVGSTAAAGGLALALRRRGIDADPLKVALDDDRARADARVLSDAVGSHTPQLLNASDTDAAAEELAEAAAGARVLVVDGLPLSDASAHLAARVGARVVGVQPYGVEPAPWRAAFGDALAGVLVNRRARYAEHDAATRLAPRLEAEHAPVLAIVPEDRRMLAVSVNEAAERLTATFYAWPSEGARLIDRFIIGGLIAEWGGNYFGRYPDQAVIVRGGRTDIQMAALNFPLACLILSACAQPPQYVQQRAQAQRVPLMTVDAETLAVADTLEDLTRCATVHHPDKLRRFADLLQGAPGWAVVEAAAA